MEQKTASPREYLKTRVLTASPEQLQLMLYDGAIRFCEQGRQAILDRRIEDSFNLLSKAEKIILELTNGLRDEVAPEICANMRRLYLFCYDRLVLANVKKDTGALDDALRVLRELRQTWVMLMDKLNEERRTTQGDDRAAASGPQSDEQGIGAGICLEG